MSTSASYAKGLLQFLHRSPTASSAVSMITDNLREKGFTPLRERDPWNVKPGTPFYIVRSSSSVIAGIMGNEPVSSAGFRLVSAHTDFPGFRIKPHPERNSSAGTVMGIEVYGGPIAATWFDRDLSLAGTLSVREGNSIERIPFVLERPLFRIPSPAIHLEREVNKKGFKVDLEKNTPLFVSTSSETDVNDLLRLACESAHADRDRVCGWSLEVWDTQPPALGGIEEDLIFSGRIDNLAMCHAAVESLLGSQEETAATRLICLFNSEEVGSRTQNGAASSFLSAVMERLSGSRGDFLRSVPRSILVSADGAHGVHPNYSGKHDPSCRPTINRGPVIKINASARYTSDDLTSAYFQACAEDCGVDVQYFVSRNDMPCGSTIGPIASSMTGIRSVDVGNAMLSMHSVREMTGTGDHDDMIRVLVNHLNGKLTLKDG